MSSPVPFVDFGGEGEVIHLAHANGFPPRTYQQLVNGLTPYYHVIAMNARPLWPDSRPEDFNSWTKAADDLIQFLDEQGLSGIIGVGHSFGAICTIIAANKRPDLFKKLVLIEPVILPQWFYILSLFLPRSLVERMNPVVKKTLVRREHWQSREAAFKQFRRSKLFAHVSDSVLWDYVNSGTVDNGNSGVSLSFSKTWEVQIFLTVTDPWKDLNRLATPFLVFRGETSDAIFLSVWKKLKASKPKGIFIDLKNAGHLAPLEKPAEVATEIRTFLNSF